MKPISHKLALSALILFGGASAATFANEQVDMPDTPEMGEMIEGEVEESIKMLSEMTDSEKATLTDEEYQALKELEEKKEAEKSLQTPDWKDS